MSFPHDNEARLDIEDTYDYETLEKISNEGCKSVLCSKHKFYGETLPFFDKHESERKVGGMTIRVLALAEQLKVGTYDLLAVLLFARF